MRAKLALGLALCAACAGSSPRPSAGAGARFEALSREVFAAALEEDPVRATGLGDHRHDGRWPDLSAAGLQKRAATARDFLQKLSMIESAALSPEARVDREMLRARLEGLLFNLEELRVYQQNPLTYVGELGSGLDPLITRSFATPDERAQSLAERLRTLGPIVLAAKQNLQRPPRVFTEAAAAQATGLVKLVEKQLAPAFAQASETRRAALEAAAREALPRLRELNDFFAGELLARSDGDFRLGPALWAKKVKLQLDSPLPPEEVVKGARELLWRTVDEMAATAGELWPELFHEPAPAATTPEQRHELVRRALSKLAEEQSGPSLIVPHAKRGVLDATAFIKGRGFISLPGEPVDVIEMPAHRRGVAAVYCDSSGPLETRRETFVAISPPPDEWSEQQKSSFYREYNDSMLADLVVHEAMPGHYLQIAFGNRFHSPVRELYRSGTFTEGWAVYAEWLMAKHGFGGARVRMMRQKMLVRVAANAVLDHGVHTAAMTEAQAMHLLRDEAFQEEGEARGKWRRAQLTAAQLSQYYVGFTEMMALREAAEKKPGFDERAYHDAVLAHGSPPPWALRELLGL